MIKSSPALLVGVPRSGTKMLRELLRMHPDTHALLYEEERIWLRGIRHRAGLRVPADELQESSRLYLRRHFSRRVQRHPGKLILDKNTANCLRLGYARKAFPDSPIIHIHRDGRSVAASLRTRWLQPLDWRYIIRERAFPLAEAPFFIARQLRLLQERLQTGERRVKWYGIRFDGIEEMLREKELIEVCARQWVEGITAIQEDTASWGDTLYCQVRYEDLLSSPVEVLKELFDFLGLSHDAATLKFASAYIRSGGKERWKKVLTADEIRLVQAIQAPLLRQMGYEA